jgi:prevent-host-death family protein
MDAGGSMGSPRRARSTKPRNEPRYVPASVFKAKCLELMYEVAARGTEFVITKHGRPFVRVAPVDDAAPDPLGRLRGTVTGNDTLVGPDQETWEPPATDPLQRRTR